MGDYYGGPGNESYFPALHPKVLFALTWQTLCSLFYEGSVSGKVRVRPRTSRKRKIQWARVGW